MRYARHATLTLALLGVTFFCVRPADAQPRTERPTPAAYVADADQSPILLARNFHYKARVHPYGYKVKHRAAPRYYYQHYYQPYYPYRARYYHPGWSRGYYRAPFEFYYYGPRASFGFGF